MRKKVLQLVRGTAIAMAMVMFIISGHIWNVDRVHAPTIYAFDFMIALLVLFIVAIFMQDAGEKRKNVNVIILVTMSGLMTAFSLAAVN